MAIARERSEQIWGFSVLCDLEQGKADMNSCVNYFKWQEFPGSCDKEEATFTGALLESMPD